MLKELADFTELRRKPDDFNTTNSKQSTYVGNVELDLESNEMILKSFKDLREKMKGSQKDNQQLR